MAVGQCIVGERSTVGEERRRSREETGVDGWMSSRWDIRRERKKEERKEKQKEIGKDATAT